MALKVSLTTVLDLQSLETRIVARYADAIRSELEERTPGPDKDNWVSSPVSDGMRLSNRSDYLPFVIRGTGLHGPNNDWIRPKTAKVLSWMQNGTRIFATRSAGMEPQPFVRESIEAGMRKVGGI